MELGDLHDIVLPAPSSLFPATTAWLVLLGVAAALAVIGLVVYVRHRRANRYRREALAQLAEIENRGSLDEIPELVKRVALCLAPREEVASLSGEGYLRFLDDRFAGSGFTQGVGRLIPTIAYGGVAGLDENDISQLYRLLSQWIRKHRARV